MLHSTPSGLARLRHIFHRLHRGYSHSNNVACLHIFPRLHLFTFKQRGASATHFPKVAQAAIHIQTTWRVDKVSTFIRSNQMKNEFDLIKNQSLIAGVSQLSK
ncbi:MAG TPA: hypothetical protein ENG03_09250 [Thioploca sp.]|nr:MAG: hypothetical protein B6247_15880 [Beggiatoa sp. 4572_84]RKZ61958.1 MAG: hypothetical protein DRR08_07380 [Gammaproteobacteria bacterium]HDN27262.1 hypothetical protein [Thioploca sp.]